MRAASVPWASRRVTCGSQRRRSPSSGWRFLSGVLVSRSLRARRSSSVAWSVGVVVVSAGVPMLRSCPRLTQLRHAASRSYGILPLARHVSLNFSSSQSGSSP